MDFPTQSLDVEHSNLLKSIEFARQLVYLNDNQINKYEQDEDGTKKQTLKANTSYVSQWLIPSLCDRSSIVAHDVEFSVITKKIRDGVLCNQSDIDTPFRRSGYWTVLKVS